MTLHVMVMASTAASLINFRGPLIDCLIGRGLRVTAAAPDISPEFVQILHQRGAEACQTTFSRTGMNPVADLLAARRIERALARCRPDILLTSTIKPNIWGPIAGRRVGVPRIVAMINGLGYAFAPGPGLRKAVASHMARRLYRLALQRCNRVVLQNPDDRDEILSLGILDDPGKAVLVNGSGVDLDHYAVSPLPEKPVFLMLARLLAEKGVREYAAAAARLRKDHPDARFLLAGNFDSNPGSVKPEELKNWLSEGAIDYLGSLADVRPALAESSIYVLPSYYREGIPRSILEALSSGRPVITTDSPGCRETVINGVNGFLVPPRNVDALVVAMARLVTAPDLVAAMGRQSRAIAEERFDVHLVNAQMMEVMGL